MMPVEPVIYEGAQLIIFAENQPQYLRLPASVDAHGVVMTEWELTDDEVEALLCGGRVRLWVHTFNEPLQPLSLEVVASGETKES